MSETYQSPGNTMQRDIEQTAQKVISRGGNNLSERLVSKTGLLMGLLIVVCATVLAVHWPVLSAQALSFDDDQYLMENSLVQNPGWTSARRFLTEVLEPSTVRGYYQPLAMISLMTDYSLGGRSDNLQPFHRTGLALHVVNTALVITLLYLLFGRAWVAAGVGLLFGLHPMTVEIISWVSNRKDLLASFFAFWCLILYVHFTLKNNWRFYLICMVMYVLALMSKPTSTPLPVLMLLMDYWPLKRLKRRAILEKLPFFVVGGISAIITYISQNRTAGAALPGWCGLQNIPLLLCHNIIFYLYKIVWPTNLSSFYPYPVPLGVSDPMVLAGVIGTCILISFLAISLRWTRAVLTGWLLFFVALLPTMGVVGFTHMIAADRYVYLPSIGLLMVLASFLGWFCSTSRLGMPRARRIPVVIIVLVLAGAEAVATRSYLFYWRDTVGLHKHMLTLTPDSAPVHYNLGLVFKSEGNLDEAIKHFRQALRSEPNHTEAYNNLGTALKLRGNLDEAIRCYRMALLIKPDYAECYYNIALTLQSQGKLDEAISQYRKALKIKPDYADAHNNLALTLQARGRLNEAIDHYRQALQSKPDYTKAHNNLGLALAEQGKIAEAISHYRQAIEFKPDYAKAHYNLGLALEKQDKSNEAITHYKHAVKIAPDYAKAHYSLALALAKQDKLDEAMSHFIRTAQIMPGWPFPLIHIAKILATHPNPKRRDTSKAVELARRAAKLTEYKDAYVLEELASVYAAVGQFDRAVTTAQAAHALASAAQNNELANHIRKQLELYRRARP